MRGRTWVYTPHIGGRTIPPAVRERTERRIMEHARKRYAGRYTRLGVRFKGALCYIDAFIDPVAPTRAHLQRLGETRQEYLERRRSVPIHLCRLRYFGNEDAWSLAFFMYSNERYYTRPACSIVARFMALQRSFRRRCGVLARAQG